ncbi:MAG: preprotein translocase subunit SecE [Deltaproteobacteria bacterium]|jgi:preprotein translocase subunit SecE|nr:preprotein translocase subunit SecE [Deltaproteobacteria bacterium]
MTKKPNVASDEGKEGIAAQISRLVAYVEDSRNELRKVSWPTLKETRSATLVVLGFVAVVAVLPGGVDRALSKLVQLILS